MGRGEGGREGGRKLGREERIERRGQLIKTAEHSLCPTSIVLTAHCFTVS